MTRRSESQRRAYKVGSEVDKITQEDFIDLLAKYENCCWICNISLENEKIHWDHVHPLSKGGAHSVDNLRPACAPCNVIKSSRWPLSDKLLGEIKVQNLSSRIMAGGDAQ
jgi:5-methylcytosine-specific restriction endonuclease McrA